MHRCARPSVRPLFQFALRREPEEREKKGIQFAAADPSEMCSSKARAQRAAELRLDFGKEVCLLAATSCNATTVVVAAAFAVFARFSLSRLPCASLVILP